MYTRTSRQFYDIHGPDKYTIPILYLIASTAQYCKHTGAHPHKDLDRRHCDIHLRAGPQTRRVIAGVTTSYNAAAGW